VFLLCFYDKNIYFSYISHLFRNTHVLYFKHEMHCFDNVFMRFHCVCIAVTSIFRTFNIDTIVTYGVDLIGKGCWGARACQIVVGYSYFFFNFLPVTTYKGYFVYSVDFRINFSCKLSKKSFTFIGFLHFCTSHYNRKIQYSSIPPNVK
jgi:hypothetical protein